VLARWGARNEKKLRELAKTSGLHAIATTLTEARTHVIELSKISGQSAVPADATPSAEEEIPEATAVEVQAEFQRN